MKQEKLLVLLCGMVQRKDVMMLASSTLDPAMFNGPNEQVVRVVYTALLEHFNRHKDLPTKELLLVNAREMASYLDPSEQKNLAPMVRSIYEIQAPGTEPLSDLLQKFLEEKQVRDVLSRGRSVKDLGAFLNELGRSYQRSQVASGGIESVDVLDPDTEDYLEPRTPIGLPFIDQLNSGGLAEGNMTGLLGPSGGGKTPLTINVDVAAAERGINVLHITAEQSAKELRPGFKACALRCRRDELMGKAVLTEAQRARLNEVRQHLRIADFSAGRCQGLGYAEIEQAVDMHEMSEFSPRFIAIDWIGPIVRRALYRRNGNADGMRHEAMEFIDRLSQLARARGYHIWIAHQLASAKAGNPTGKVSGMDAQDFKSFSDITDCTAAISGLDSGSHCTNFCATKLRWGFPFEEIIRLDVETSRFVSAEDDYSISGRTGKFVPAEEAHDLPTI